MNLVLESLLEMPRTAFITSIISLIGIFLVAWFQGFEPYTAIAIACSALFANNIAFTMGYKRGKNAPQEVP